MKKILIINTVPFGMGGMSSVIVNYLNNMNKHGLDITIIVNSRIEKVYEDNLRKNGVKIIILKRNYRIMKYIHQLYKVMKHGNFDVVHIHGNSATMAFESIPAYLTRIPQRIVHCHNVSCEHKILNEILKPFLNKTYTLACACSIQAGKWLFKTNEQFLVLNNAISLEKYKFNDNVRTKIQEELQINDSYVIGHIGYFNEQKNHEKLFEIVNYLKYKIDVKLLCIAGNSTIPNNIKEMITKYKLEDNIIILLKRNDVNELLQGMDCFVFPSRYEGLGVALIEAQATGLNCLASDKVPGAAMVCEELVNYCDLLADCSEWGELILDVKENTINSRKDREISAMKILKEVGYDISIEAEKLRKLYMK